MSVLVDKKTKVIVQGITGTQASFHIQRAMKYGTKVVAGVVPNKKEKYHLGVPLFETVKEAKELTNATVSLIFVPAKSAKKAILEAIDAEMDVVVVITSGIPVVDMMEIKKRLLKSKTTLIGPNTPGVITLGEAYLGIYPDTFHKKGNIGIISRSSTLTYEVVLELNKIGLGQSSIVGLGDDFVVGAGFVDIIEKFNNDKKTDTIVLIGGIEGNYELDLAERYSGLNVNKKVIALMIDDPAALSRFNGIASEIICNGVTETYKKREILSNQGIVVVDNIDALKNELLKE